MKHARARKIIHVGFIAIMAVTVFLAAACKHDKQDEAGGEYDYSAIGDILTITRYKGKGGNITIPEKIEGITVHIIGDNAFKNRSDITGVTFPAKVSTIGSGAFANCKNLISVIFTGAPVTFVENSFTGKLYDEYYKDMQNVTSGTFTTTAPVTDASTWTKK